MKLRAEGSGLYTSRLNVLAAYIDYDTCNETSAGQVSRSGVATDHFTMSPGIDPKFVWPPLRTEVPL